MADNLEWLNANSLRSYPFREDTNLVDETGAVTLPNSLVVDFVLVSPYGTDLELQLKNVLYGVDLLALTFGDVDGTIVTSVTIPLGSHTENDGYKLVGQGDYEDCVGRVAIGKTSELADVMPQGSYSFSTGSALLEATTIRPDVRGVRALKVVHADGSESNPIYGNVKLLEGLNIRLVPQADGVRIDAITTDLEEDCECDSELLKPGPIRSLSGVIPDVNGNIEIITVGENIAISGGIGKLVITDTSTQPCCGCEELEAITAAAQLAQDTADKVANRAEQLAARQNSLGENVIRTIT